jgi:phage baseplate assembly protein W
MTTGNRPDFIGSGWSFPVAVDRRTGGIRLAYREQDVAQAIQLILRTPLGERRMRPTFGCGIHSLVFSTNDPTTHGLIRHYVTEALALWEPRILVNEEDIEVSLDPDQPSAVLIQIGYRLRATNERRNIVYPFYLIPVEE